MEMACSVLLLFGSYLRGGSDSSPESRQRSSRDNKSLTCQREPNFRHIKGSASHTSETHLGEEVEIVIIEHDDA